MTVQYLRPTPLGEEVELTARVLEVEGQSTAVACVLSCAGKERARATVRAVRVPASWRHGAA